ncbi:LacI family DNA-binding transcriptional regulator [Parablautia sp. Marseille-Q6255]|uniref:LacI family DNA-binding transcriptional regulator n=1 Tax=Parablautia sp. Marseille-Q6255 TaxID=3039593 RepID=UPI0024BC8ED8|nr:LacI family DNA-binding transcriptional regulator [Parablautia sp. Marseille-Q6255]
MGQLTIKEVAKLCGVGVSTVSRAINDHPDINEDTKKKIMDTIREYNYIPNNSARNLKRIDSNTIAVLAKGITNPFFADMIQVFEREITKKRYSFILQHVEEFEDEVDVAVQLEKEKRLKGIVFLGGLSSHTADKLEQLTVPYVISTVNAAALGNGAAYVTVDDERESCRLVEYLCSCGHRRIAVLAAGRQDASIGAQRLNGYRRALEQYGIVYDDALVMRTKDGQPTYSMENGYALTKELLNLGKEFTCIYAMSDSMAIGACKALFDAGKRIPEDYSVAGYDGLTVAQYYEPSITTIRQPRREMAEATIQMLFDLIRKKPVRRQRIFEAELVLGGSTRKL